MHLQVDPQNYKATLLHGGGMIIGTLEFETYNIVDSFDKTKDILDIVFLCKDLNKTMTIRDYLKLLLLTLWKESDEFRSKRPFGNSGWQHDLYQVLFENKIINGRAEYDEDGDLLEIDYDSETGFKIICDAIKRLR